MIYPNLNIIAPDGPVSSSFSILGETNSAMTKVRTASCLYMPSLVKGFGDGSQSEQLGRQASNILGATFHSTAENLRVFSILFDPKE